MTIKEVIVMNAMSEEEKLRRQNLALVRMQILAFKSQQLLFKLTLQELPTQRKAFLFSLLFGFVALEGTGISLFALGMNLGDLMIRISSGVVEILALGGFIYLLLMFKRITTEREHIDKELELTNAIIKDLDDISNMIRNAQIKAKEEETGKMT